MFPRTGTPFSGGTRTCGFRGREAVCGCCWCRHTSTASSSAYWPTNEGPGRGRSPASVPLPPPTPSRSRRRTSANLGVVSIFVSRATAPSSAAPSPQRSTTTVTTGPAEFRARPMSGAPNNARSPGGSASFTPFSSPLPPSTAEGTSGAHSAVSVLSDAVTISTFGAVAVSAFETIDVAVVFAIVVSSVFVIVVAVVGAVVVISSRFCFQIVRFAYL
mmetsp:Transcript_50829/g.99399  ORF Transcript_50829/g.99399 Transcript_50829/m.99399 type:complete len:217 (-) Transcript_50829:11-661(-)